MNEHQVTPRSGRRSAAQKETPWTPRSTDSSTGSPTGGLTIMSVTTPDVALPPRSPAWKWWVCGLLLLATMLNYMDRLTLNLSSKLILTDLELNEGDYAQLESANQ